MATGILGTAWHVEVYEAEEGGYWGEVREMPGCLSQGETLDELKVNMTEAIEAFLPVFRKCPPLPSGAPCWSSSCPAQARNM